MTIKRPGFATNRSFRTGKVALAMAAGTFQSQLVLYAYPKTVVNCTRICKVGAFARDRFHTKISGSLKSCRIGKWRAAGGDIMEGDVVEYPLPDEVRQAGLYGDRIRFGVGAVSELVSDASSSSPLVCHIEPLVMNEPPKATWVVDERQDMVEVPITQVRRLEAWLSMRMVDDRISNPHGEHAEHLWLVEEPLSENSCSPMYDEP